jgi:predicted glycosyltransferase
MTDLTGTKAYFPVESLVGLGHFNRAGALAREMARAGMKVTVASGTFVDPGRFFPDARLKEMPPYVFKGRSRAYRLESGGAHVLVPHFNETAWAQARGRAHEGNIRALKPDVFISELWPFDRPEFDPEMKAALEAARGARLRLVSVRDALNGCDGARAAFAARTVNENFDAVLVHGDPRFMPLEETFPAAAAIAEKTVYTGYVLDSLPPRRAPAAGEGEVLVSCGSGADAQDMVFSFLTAWQRLLRAKDPVAAHPVRIVCGPRLHALEHAEAESWARALAEETGAKITVERYRPDFTELLSRAAFSVSFAGYNTTLETLALGVPALLVPKYALDADGAPMVSEEQKSRLQRLARNGLAACAMPEEVQNAGLFASRLSREITLRAGGKTQPPGLDFSGAEKTAEIVSGLLRARSSL